MTDNLDAHIFEILSLTHGEPPVGVNHTKPARQVVYANAPVHHWTFHKVGENKYKLSIDGYRFTGVHDGKIVASIHHEDEEEWVITHHEHHKASTIALAKKPHLGWTVPINIEGRHGLELKPIIATHSIPPHFLPTQLFLFKKVE